MSNKVFASKQPWINGLGVYKAMIIAGYKQVEKNNTSISGECDMESLDDYLEEVLSAAEYIRNDIARYKRTKS